MSQNDNHEVGCFVASVLLSQKQWDKKKFISDFKTDWKIDLSGNDNNDDTLVATIGDMTLAVALMPAPVPNGEAEHYAAANYIWPDAVKVAQSHKAHILVSVTGKDADLLERGKLFSKAVSSCLKQQYALAAYTDGTVFQPRFYIQAASLMQRHEGMLPILNWVWFGAHRTDKYSGIYTCGMRKFGKEEMEIYADADLGDIREFLLNIVSYILEMNVTLQDDETIGFSAGQKQSITLSKGIAVEGMSLKIDYAK